MYEDAEEEGEAVPVVDSRIGECDGEGLEVEVRFAAG
jgi:hypothetical protein